MSAAVTEKAPQPTYPEIISQLLKADLLDKSEKPLIRGALWQRVKDRLPGCFPDIFSIGDLPDLPTPEQGIARFKKLFDPVHETLLDLAGMGILGFQNCVEKIRREFPVPGNPDFPNNVIAAASNNGTYPLAITTLRAIRILTIAIDLGLVTISK